MKVHINGTEFGLEATLSDRHRDDSRFSDFQGTEGELVMLFASFFMDTLRRLGGLSKFPPGKDPGTYVMKGVKNHIGLFRGMSISRDTHGVIDAARVKPPAVSVDFIVRVLGVYKNGKPRRVELIDFQAWPTERDGGKSESQSAA